MATATSASTSLSSDEVVDMSAPSSLLTEDQFLCSICLEVFTDPVAIPCGHNFCKACITEHWDKNAKCQCPNCKKIFNTRPELQVNTLISGVAAQFRQSAPQKASSNSSSSKSGSEQQVSKPGEVLCDFCTETKMKALKSCLVCLASYCETHLKPHLTMTGMKRHQLIDPVENLEGRMCTQHDKPLDLFCQTDQTCVCVLCTYSDHKAHDIVPLKDEYEGKKAELGEREAEIQKMIQQKQVKIQEFKRSVEKSKKNADKEMADGVQVFTALKESVEKSQDKFINTIKEKQRKTEKQAEGFIKELEQEISELKKTSSEMKQLSRTEDHLHLLQNFPSVNVTPPTKDWTEVSIRPPSFEGSVVRAVAQLEETLSKQTKKLFEAELKRVQQYAVNVTLDPNTVRPSLGQASQDCRCVLSEKGFTSGRFYFEFEVKTWSVWTLGVARNRRSFSKKRTVQLRPKNGYWTVCRMCQGDFSAPADPSVGLTLKSHPEKVGVFVDYEEGLVCFFDVDAAALIYSFTDCHFTDKLSPFFSPCPNDNFETHNLERCVLQ